MGLVDTQLYQVLHHQQVLVQDCKYKQGPLSDNRGLFFELGSLTDHFSDQIDIPCLGSSEYIFKRLFVDSHIFGQFAFGIGNFAQFIKISIKIQQILNAYDVICID